MNLLMEYIIEQTAVTSLRDTLLRNWLRGEARVKV